MKQRISNLQAIAIVVNAIVPSSILFIPSYVIQISKQDGWITVLLALAAGLLFAYAIGSVARHNNRASLMAWLESSFGRWVAFVIGLVLCAYYFITAATMIRQFANYMSEQIMMNTPLFMLVGIIVLVSVYMVSQGIEAMGRVHFIVLVLVLLFVAINIVLLWEQYDFKQFLPILEVAPVRHIPAGIMPLGWFSEIATLLLLVPFLDKKDSVIRIAVWGTLLAGIMVTLITAVTIAVFGTKIIGALSYPAFAAIGTVEIGQFVERVDVLLLSAWTASMFAKVSVFLFGFFHVLSHTFKMKSHLSLYVAGSALVMATALYSWPSNIVVAEFSYTTLSLFFLISNYGICCILWCALLFTRRKSGTGEAGL
ncbi:GerAB/ArcD/ProY family transporter [Paenibacillus paridis]|uniref:GerAB/ArcD/ProY family transporter n=1 Tax=Paenibacillus paridis TaxID=2583376 RepID=UPI00111D42AD|nr:endospore germination permease [Paenibacillus paridis]